MSSPATVVVVTFPRSGSSLLAGIIHRLGVPMGHDHELELGRHLNRLGCHEDQEMQHISLNVLFEAGLLLDLSRRLDIDEAALERVVRRYEHKVAAFVRARRGRIWGFKDPSLLYSLPYIHHHFDNPQYVVLLRRPDATARSLFATFRANRWLPELREKLPLFTWRNRLLLVPRALALRLTRDGSYNDLGHYQRVVEAGHRRIERFVHGRPHLRLELEDLVAEPDATVDRIVEYLELRPDGDQLAAALGFVRPDLITSG